MDGMLVFCWVPVRLGNQSNIIFESGGTREVGLNPHGNVQLKPQAQD